MTYSTELYHQIIQDYRERLSESIDLTFRSYCDERGLVYKKVVDWTTHHGISIRAMKADLLRRSDAGSLSSDLFVQVVPRRDSSQYGLIKGANITFSDGVVLHLEECSCENIISLLTIYKERQQQREVICSR